jgi:hypothetical protein
MSIWNAIVDVATNTAAKGAAGLPAEGAGTLATQTEIWGFGATSIGTTAEAASHGVSPEVALTAVGIGVGVLLLLPEGAVIGSAAAIAEIVLPMLPLGFSATALEAIVAGVLEVGIAGLAESAALPVLQALFQPSDAIKGADGLYGVAPTLASPLILDLDGDGIETTKLGFGPAASPVHFDLDGDAFAERTGWVGGGDGLLAWDKNSNGTIDDNGELFGNTATYADGFANLAVLDTNSDDKITSADTNWSDLRVWVDANGDGITDSGELKTFATLGITEISVNATPLTNTYNDENLVSATSTFVIGGQTRTISDVWFRTDEMDSRNLTPVEIVEAALYLPTLKGFGLLKDLPLAASEDEDILDLVATFATTWSTERFGDEASLDSDIREILFLWAGVDGVSQPHAGAMRMHKNSNS